MHNLIHRAFFISKIISKKPISTNFVVSYKLYQFPSKNKQYEKIFFKIKIVKNASLIPIGLKAFCNFWPKR